MAAFLDNVRFTPTAGGTTDWTYSSAVAGYQAPAAAGVVNGTKYKYFALSSDLTQWEIGEGAYNTSTGVLSRTTVLFNSSGTGSAPGQSGAGTKISFSAAPTVAIVGLAEDLASPAINRSYLAGLTLSTAGSSATFSVAAGTATDSGNTDFMLLGASISKTTSAWAVGSGNGALDTGAIAASTWYQVHLIKRVDTQVVDVLVSLSATSPTLPSGYMVFRRLGSMKTNASSQWTAFTQLGDEFLWKVPVTDLNAVASASGVTAYTISVPPGVQVYAKLNALAAYSSAVQQGIISSPDVAYTSSITPAMYQFYAFNGGQVAADLAVRTNTAAQVDVAASGAGFIWYVNTYGWIDRRGRDA